MSANAAFVKKIFTPKDFHCYELFKQPPGGTFHKHSRDAILPHVHIHLLSFDEERHL